MKPPSKKKKTVYFADTDLFNRVDNYLDDNIDKPVIDKEAMVEDLREMYVEYKRRNRNAFRAAVFKAYDLINEMMSEPTDASVNVSADDGLDEDVSMEHDESSNITELTPNRSPIAYIESVRSMASAAAARNNTAELINISSDEEAEEAPAPRPATVIETSPKQSSLPKNALDARMLIARNSAITISTVNPKSPRNILGKRKMPYFPVISNQKFASPVSIPNITFKDFGGNYKVLEAVSGLLLHLHYFDVYIRVGVQPPRGFLLHGPPGCGKTLLAKAIAGELRIPLIRAAGPELVGGVSGESEQRIRDLFNQAKEQSPCIIFIDEIDAIFPPRESARKDMERRIVAQIISSFDDLNDAIDGHGIAVIGATNNPDSLDPALRRAGRFDREICLGIPDRSDRKSILEVLFRSIKVSKDVCLDKVADLTPGFVGADLNALCSQAGIAAVTRIIAVNNKESSVDKVKDVTCISDEKEKTEGDKNENSEPPEVEIMDTSGSQSNDVSQKNFTSSLFKRVFNINNQQLDNVCIEMDDILNALKSVQPSAKREGFATVPDVSWNDIGSLKEVKDKLDISIMIPVKYPALFERIGVRAPSGVLLYGPPGCGKTLVAKAVANEANINFISVKGPELLNMYVGESERAVRQCFQRARNSQPCVIFFDEIDALCPRRSDSTEGSVSSRVVNQVLTEMDGVEDRQGVFLMAATNRPDMVDPAVLRPGRLDKLVYVGLPNPEDRVDILRAITKGGTKPKFSDDITLEEIGLKDECTGYSGADLAALVREASVLALTEYVKKEKQEDRDGGEPDILVSQHHFIKAFEQIKPSVSEVDHLRYKQFHSMYGSKVKENHHVP
ncbi:hypothetical protein O3M35_002278 [Rhynocoris fuscipes]|uniref:AAA+ ATPase domain-containing protein n=1 Tax=Rhynocoris fuscipes TaxID=488301 RepID=A0AAW1CQN8_9HEMI